MGKMRRSLTAELTPGVFGNYLMKTLFFPFPFLLSKLNFFWRTSMAKMQFSFEA